MIVPSSIIAFLLIIDCFEINFSHLKLSLILRILSKIFFLKKLSPNVIMPFIFFYLLTFLNLCFYLKFFFFSKIMNLSFTFSSIKPTILYDGVLSISLTIILKFLLNPNNKIFFMFIFLSL